MLLSCTLMARLLVQVWLQLLRSVGTFLVVDEAVYEPLMTGVYLSRANVQWFKHNDMEDLERVLKDLQLQDKKLGRKPNAHRRYIVVEGLYKNLETIAPLDRSVQPKQKHHYRLILDESFSFWAKREGELWSTSTTCGQCTMQRS
jgi:7-keto-8-aminopelargonate synthetase-like enzyme